MCSVIRYRYSKVQEHTQTAAHVRRCLEDQEVLYLYSADRIGTGFIQYSTAVLDSPNAIFLLTQSEDAGLAAH